MSVDETNSNFICQITGEIMTDPVIDREGNTYERRAIEEWVKLHGTSPITRRPLHSSDLTPNRVLKNAIDEARQKMASNGLTLSARTTNSSSVSRLNTVPASSVGAGAMDEVAPMISFRSMYRRTANEDAAVAKYDCLVTVTTEETNRSGVPSDIVVVIDTSGSMGNEAKTQSVETSGLSLLDVVKHGVKTIIQTLGPNDRLAVVSFSNYATVVCELIVMDARGKVEATEQLNKLMPEGMTNIWDGLQVAMDLLKNRVPLPGARSTNGGRNAAILLLTDGEPNIEPPRGHLPMLRKYRDSNGGNYPGFISTFGFGYALDSQLLVSIAKECGGMYAFIPDSGFVGTAFVNAVANILSTVAADCSISIENARDTSILDPIPGAMPLNYVTWGAMGIFGSVQLGQNQDCVLQISAPASERPPFFNVLGKYRASGTSQDGEVIQVEGSDRGLDPDVSDEIDFHMFRCKFIVCITNIFPFMAMDPPNLAGADNIVRTLIAELRSWLAGHTDPNRGPMNESNHGMSWYRKIHFLCEDLSGQVTQAVSRVDWFRKWGRHYLPALSRAHELQQCNNFKDVGIQHYGGSLFRTIRDTADDVFCRLPAPVAARPILSFSALAAAQAGQPLPVAAPISMTSFNDRSMPCFHEDCTVQLASGEVTSLLQLKRGDVLSTGSRVLCIVRTLCPGSRAGLVHLPGGLLVTPWHPVKTRQQWTFPANLGQVEDTACRSVISVVLDPSFGYYDSLFVNGIEAVAMGHSIQHDAVASHDYFGASVVVKDLQQCVGWSSGRIEFNCGCLSRLSVAIVDQGMSELPLVSGFQIAKEISVTN